VTGCEAVELPPSLPMNVAQLWKMLIGKYPALANHQKNVRLARNWEYADAKTIFANEDEIALIPPVSGG
jgi:molybdopterin converting factor small subunit